MPNLVDTPPVSPAGMLTFQKKAVLLGMLEALAATLLSFILFTAVPLALILTSDSPQQEMVLGVVILPLTSFFTVLFFIDFVQFLRLHLLLKHVRSSEHHKVCFCCKDIRFIFRGGRANLVVYIVLTDESGQKYHYVHSKKNDPLHTFEAEQLQQRLLNTTIEPDCYLGSNIIVSLDF